jgi:hypothetical protein
MEIEAFCLTSLVIWPIFRLGSAQLETPFVPRKRRQTNYELYWHEPVCSAEQSRGAGFGLKVK